MGVLGVHQPAMATGFHQPCEIRPAAPHHQSGSRQLLRPLVLHSSTLKAPDGRATVRGLAQIG